MKYFLGIAIHQSFNGIFVGEQIDSTNIIKNFRMTDCKLVDTPISQGTNLNKEYVAPPVDPTLYKSLVGTLLYLFDTWETNRACLRWRSSFVYAEEVGE